MNKKLVIIHILIFLSLTVLISAPITSSSQVFRAILYDDSGEESTAVISVIPSTVNIKSEKNVWDLKNDVVTLDATPYEIFTWEIVASTYSPVTLRFITSPLQKEGDPTHKINFRLDFELNPPTLFNYKMYLQNNSNSYKEVSSLKLSGLDSNSFYGQTVSGGSIKINKKYHYYDYVMYKINQGSNTFVSKPVLYDFVTNVSKINDKFVASLESTSNEPLDIIYELKVKNGSNYHPLNYGITRTGTAKISLDMPSQVTYGTYITPLYVELEVQ